MLVGRRGWGRGREYILQEESTTTGEFVNAQVLVQVQLVLATTSHGLHNIQQCIYKYCQQTMVLDTNYVLDAGLGAEKRAGTHLHARESQTESKGFHKEAPYLCL